MTPKCSTAPSRQRKRSELAYVLAAYKRLRAKGILSRWEAPLLGRSIDLVYWDGQSVVSIEFKLKDWRRGLRQARDHRIGADYAYLCMPMAEPSDEMCRAAAEAEVGLLAFDEQGDMPFRTALPAPRSSVTSPFARDSLRAMLRSA
jgi:hypothetical protein